VSVRWAAAAWAALAASACHPAHAQTPPPWSAVVRYEIDEFAGSAPAWSRWWEAHALVSRRVARVTVAVEAAVLHRFGLRDEAVAGEAYVNLWPGAYAHARAGVAPGARLVALSDWRLALFHALPGGWEATGNLWLQNLPGADVEVFGIGMARYVGPWYLRGQVSLARIAGGSAGAGAVFARRFLGDPQQYVEGGAGLGSEVVVLGPGPVVDARATRFLAVNFQRFVRGPLGVQASAGLNDFEGVPLRRHLAVGLIARF
jgi:YaiO family outer membrane protein